MTRSLANINEGRAKRNTNSTKQEEKVSKSKSDEKILKAFTIEKEVAKVIEKLGKKAGRGGISKLANQLLKEGIKNEEMIKGLEKEDEEVDIFELIENKKDENRVLKGYTIDVKVASVIDNLGEKHGISKVAEHLIREGLKERGYLN